jgi:hypothetical protein
VRKSTISLANAAPFTPAALAVSTAPGPAGLPCAFNIDVGQLLPFPNAPLGVAVVAVDAIGSGSVPIPLPNIPALHGFTAYAQWAAVDSAGGFQAGGLSLSPSRGRKIIIW